MDINLFQHEPVLLKEMLEYFPPFLQSEKKLQLPVTSSSKTFVSLKTSFLDSSVGSSSVDSSSVGSSSVGSSSVGSSSVDSSSVGSSSVGSSSVKPVLSPATPRRWVLDTTFGAGGHTQAILNRYSSVSVIALDCDRVAVKWGITHIKPQFPKGVLQVLPANFHNYSDLMKNHFPQFLKGKGFDIIIMDLGVSSPQLDQAQRGFSFYRDGPLDMRMDRTQSFSARDIINQWSEKELLDLFYTYGEIHNSSLVVKALLRQRKRASIEGTKELADLIVKKQGWRKKGAHPATPYFLALRLKVNNELEGLKENLPKMIQSLNPRGRVLVLTFHSLEDRIVKNIFRQANMKEGRNLTKKVVKPRKEEIRKNPRARSAKLRVFERKE